MRGSFPLIPKKIWRNNEPRGEPVEGFRVEGLRKNGKKSGQGVWIYTPTGSKKLDFCFGRVGAKCIYYPNTLSV